MATGQETELLVMREAMGGGGWRELAYPWRMDFKLLRVDGRSFCYWQPRVSNMQSATLVCVEQVCGGKSIHNGGCPTQVGSLLAACTHASNDTLNISTYRPIIQDDGSKAIREAIDKGESHGSINATR